MSIKTRLVKLESIGKPYACIADKLNAVQVKRKAGHKCSLKSEGDLRAILATSKNRLELRLAHILLRRISQ